MQVRQEEDRLPSGIIVAVIAAVLLLSALGAAFAYFMLRGDEIRLRPSGRFAERDLPPPSEMAHIEQTLFRAEAQGLELQATKRTVLERYGWVDRDQGTVRIPIQRAMELVLEGDPP